MCRATNTLLLDRCTVCGPMFLFNHLCLSESWLHLPAMLLECSPTILLLSIFRGGSETLLSTTCWTHTHVQYACGPVDPTRLFSCMIMLLCVNDGGHPEYELMDTQLWTHLYRKALVIESSTQK